MIEKLSRKKLDIEHRKFIAESTYLEMQCFLNNLPMTHKLKLEIIDRMEELECDTLLQQFLIDLQDSSKYHIV
mgnify:CR=1 FL=1